MASLAFTTSQAHEPMPEPLPRSVLVIDQSTSFRPWPSAIIGAIRSTIDDSTREPTSFYIENLDLYHFNGPRYEDSLQNHLREKYRDKPIGVIIVIGPTGLAYGLKLRGALWPSVPVVFAAVDEDTATKSPLPHDVTGTAVRMTLADMVTAARTLLPNLKRFAIVGDPLPQHPYYSHFAEEIPAVSRELAFIDLTSLPLAEVRTRVATLPEDTVIFYIGINYGPDVTYVAAEVLPLITAVANRPIVVNVETFLGSGAVGGFILTPAQIGKEAGRLALRILAGETASSIPVTTGESLRPIFDWRQLQRWQISEQRLPPGSEVRFQESTLWEQYRIQIVALFAVLVAQALLITGLIYEHRWRRKAEVGARASMSELARVNRIATAGALSASIAHEVNQPLTSVVASANAALRWLSGATPDIERARMSLAQIINAGHRASDVIKSIRAMFKKDDETRLPLNINGLISQVLALVRIDLERHQVTLQTQLEGDLPPVIGDRIQLQQVLLNLIMNAVDSMDATTDRPRVLRVGSTLKQPERVLVSVEDNGTGIDPDDADRIFAPLFTTKSRGMGMGLSICRSIIETHHGRLWASPGEKSGSVFQFALPTNGHRR